MSNDVDLINKSEDDKARQRAVADSHERDKADKNADQSVSGGRLYAIERAGRGEVSLQYRHPGGDKHTISRKISFEEMTNPDALAKSVGLFLAAHPDKSAKVEFAIDPRTKQPKMVIASSKSDSEKFLQNMERMTGYTSELVPTDYTAEELANKQTHLTPEQQEAFRKNAYQALGKASHYKKEWEKGTFKETPSEEVGAPTERSSHDENKSQAQVISGTQSPPVAAAPGNDLGTAHEQAREAVKNLNLFVPKPVDRSALASDYQKVEDMKLKTPITLNSGIETAAAPASTPRPLFPTPASAQSLPR